MKINYFLSAFVVLLIITMESLASPAKPVKHLLSQPDGTMLEVFLRGDEFLHYYETFDGVLLKQADNGSWNYAVLSEENSVIAGKYVAKMPLFRSVEEQVYVKGINKTALRNVLENKAEKARSVRQKVMPGEIKATFPTTGVVRGLVILAQYQDIKFSKDATSELYKKVIAEDNYVGDISSGSVRDYFVDQSNGLFTPEFDVVGPVTLPQKRAYYGSGSNDGKEKVSEMVIDACLLADNEFDVDFSRYDSNDDGAVDFVYVIYAGHGEAQGGPGESVWPQSSTLEYVYWKKLDGMYLGHYSCSCELKGASGEELDGIGTFCHEFSHILGLPDIYDPISVFIGMGYWDVMDIGSYNNDSKTPAGYTAMDKYTLGWLTPEVLTEPQGDVKLEALSASNKAYFIVSEKNPNEYYTLENRQNVGWDAYLPGHGLLISHIDYDLHLWNSNRVNTVAAGHERVKLIAADGDVEKNDAGDTYPGETNNTSFTDTSKPASVWHTGGKVGKPLKNIREENGVIHFDFMGGSGIKLMEGNCMAVYAEGNRIVCSNPEKREVSIYTIDGILLSAFSDTSFEISVNEGVYVVKIDGEVKKLKVGR